jgi:DNA-binding winged helix-turn-helix (wHTH) protein/tetratricopeptide (TPR) repeat protein
VFKHGCGETVVSSARKCVGTMDRLESASAGFAHTGHRFGGFRLDADGTLLHGVSRIHLSRNELAALRLLLANPIRIVTPQELKRALWGDEPVPADSISKCLASLRHKLDREECIETVYKRGYRLSVAVKPLGDSAGPLPRLAILPFTTEFGVPDYLGESIAEEAYARIGGAQPPLASVAAKDSVFALARLELAPQKIGEMLKADLVLHGTLSALPAHYRLRAEMLHGADGSPAWTEDLLVERGRIGGLETELVNLVSRRMNTGGLSIAASAAPEGEAERQLDPGRMAQRREAYEIFQRARYEWQTLERHRMQDALQHLLRAVELDPDLTAARVQVAYLCNTQAFYGFMLPAVAADIVRKTAGTPAEVPAGAERILPALGWISFHVDRNLPAALWSFRRAGHLPYCPWLTRARVTLALNRHRFGEAIELLQSAICIDPWSAWLQSRLAWAHHLAGKASTSVELAHTALERFPLHEGAQLYGAIILAFSGEAERAVELAGGLARRLPYLDLATAVHAYTLAMAGHQDAARHILERLEWLSRERYVLKTFSPAVYAVLGEPDTALATLRSAEQLHCPWFFQMLADPRLAPLRKRPEFQSMLGILAGMEAEAERDELET